MRHSSINSNLLRGNINNKIAHLQAHQSQQWGTHAESLANRGPEMGHAVDVGQRNGGGVGAKNTQLFFVQVLLQLGIGAVLMVCGV